jgi:hypothetical protein
MKQEQEIRRERLVLWLIFAALDTLQFVSGLVNYVGELLAERAATIVGEPAVIHL